MCLFFDATQFKFVDMTFHRVISQIAFNRQIARLVSAEIFSSAFIYSTWWLLEMKHSTPEKESLIILMKVISLVSLPQTQPHNSWKTWRRSLCMNVCGEKVVSTIILVRSGKMNFENILQHHNYHKNIDTVM